MAKKKYLLGAHTSINGGLENALIEGNLIGASTIQIFTANQRRWENKKICKKEILTWESTRASLNIRIVSAHASYLINLAASDFNKSERSLGALIGEIGRCTDLGIQYMIFHPGSAVDCSEEKALENVANNIIRMESVFDNRHVRTTVLVENSAGQGSTVGWSFEHLDYITKKVSGKIPFGICLDTCHMFAAGYDISTKENFVNVIDSFDKIVGIKHLKAMHLNNSFFPLGSKKDRHAPITQGKIDVDTFYEIMRLFPKIPKYLETPGKAVLWKEEIAMLTKIRSVYEN